MAKGAVKPKLITAEEKAQKEIKEWDKKYKHDHSTMIHAFSKAQAYDFQSQHQPKKKKQLLKKRDSWLKAYDSAKKRKNRDQKL